LDRENKAELEQEIKEAQKFLDWLFNRIEARAIDIDKAVLNTLIDIKTNQEEYLDKIRREYTEKYC